jgi:hypothetical protein
MHGMFTMVRIEPGKFHDLGTRMIREDLLPQVRQAPGFVKAVWFGDGETGHGLILFDTEEQAQAANQFVPAIEFDGVQVISSQTYTIVAEG